MRKKRVLVMVVLGVVVGIVLLAVVFFALPYSKTRSEFAKASDRLIGDAGSSEDLFSLEDIASLPLPVQRFFIHCKFIGKPKMTHMKATFKDVDFSLGRGKPNIKIDYVQHNAVTKPQRLAYIDSSLYGIPFEGLDSFVEGKGSMKGVIAKGIDLFDERGVDMDRACLVTFLAEALFVPSVALEPYIQWEAMDDTHAKATIEAYGMSCCGIFTFSEEGEMQSFTTDDRMATGMDGTKEQVRWTAILADYQRKGDLLLPSSLQAVWNYPEGDFLYFDGRGVVIEYFSR
ncbi:MAG TPA: DUF6544 family protein [Sphaerochaeta sp.]|nr:DUF6544 family protein [Sphaerochaeta sp.]